MNRDSLSPQEIRDAHCAYVADLLSKKVQCSAIVERLANTRHVDLSTARSIVDEQLRVKREYLTVTVRKMGFKNILLGVGCAVGGIIMFAVAAPLLESIGSRILISGFFYGSLVLFFSGLALFFRGCRQIVTIPWRLKEND